LNESENSPKSFQDFAAWQDTCDQILTKPFPPKTSDFPKESLERDRKLNLSKLSNWELVCQEILDTEFSHIYYQKCYEELLRRGKSEHEILEMRRFAWYTAGWLNFVLMLWDWVSLDEADIRRAIEWLYDKKHINEEKRIEFEKFLKLHTG
jgi:hypothetical protein